MKTLSLSGFLFATFFVFSVAVVKSQGLAEDKWHQGAVVLTNGDTLKGALKYSIKNSVIRLKTRNTIKTYSPHKVVSFLFHDLNYHHNRQFISLPYAVRRSSSYKVPSFFELVRKGHPLTLLSRQTTFMRRSGRLNGFYRMVEQDIFYLLDSKGDIKRVKPSRRGISKAFSNHAKSIKTYMKVNRLKYSNRNDLIKIVDYYNSLSKRNDR